MSKWTTVLTAAEIEADYALTAKLDPSFAQQSRDFWQTRTPIQLRVLKAEAWNCSDAEQYQKAASYLALAGEPVAEDVF